MYHYLFVEIILIKVVPGGDINIRSAAALADQRPRFKRYCLDAERMLHANDNVRSYLTCKNLFNVDFSYEAYPRSRF